MLASSGVAPSCNVQSFLKRGLSPRLLALVCTVAFAFSVTESADPLHIRAEAGGNVTFRCPADEKRRPAFFYFQIGHIFVNGYYASKNINTSWENTRVEPNRTHVHMYRLNISHSGDYLCIIQYNGSNTITEVPIKLTVTAPYSKPAVTTSCSEENLGLSCFVTCASHGGYPVSKMTWNIPVSRNASSQMWRVVNSSEVPSPSTMMFNSSSTAYFNCSDGMLEYVSCSVGNVMSNLFSVCAPKVKPKSFTPVIITAACALVVVVLIIVGLLLRRCKKRNTGDAANERREWRVNGSEEEGVVLKENKGGEEAA
ncbi:CD276 antigen isoform X1 [Scophthalmus maximus]|uniref:CD276 antigen isoform X1 n=1 Tax=Scophthalmus maximus TaxID=52904 RepID=UPI0015E06457|nr:CD276 antigen isoform X1 [Scophthalmus maximus]